MASIIALGALPLHAQVNEATLSGRVVLPDSATPAVGVLIEAVSISDPSNRLRTLSDIDGGFVLHLGHAGTWRVSAMRIGYVPTSLGRFTLANGERRSMPRPVVVSGTPVGFTLTQLEIHEDEICGRSEDDSQLLVATLLSQARAALAGVALAQVTGRTAEWQRFAVFTDRLGTPVSPLRLSRYSSATHRPFGSASTDSLMHKGYLWDIDGGSQFHAPDAHVLLSEPFVSSHCYRVSAPHQERPEWIGVTFAPAQRRRGIVEVHGTLWLDRESAELRRLDFGYVGLPGGIEATNPRGIVEFLRLPTHDWVVSRWELRLPRSEVVVSRTGEVTTPSATQINLLKISGGELMTVHRGERVVFRNPTQPTARFPRLSARVGTAPICKDAPQPKATESGVLFGSVLDSLGNPVRATVRIMWTNIGRSRSVNFTEERFVSASEGTFLACGLTLGARLRVMAYIDEEQTSDEIMTRLRSPKTWALIDIEVP